MGSKCSKGNLGYIIRKSFLPVREDKRWNRLCMEVETLCLNFIGIPGGLSLVVYVS